MKHLFIVNPTAGGKDKTAQVRAQAEQLFKNREDEFEIYVTTAPMDATEKVRQLGVAGEPVRIYACGGDGTFNECISGAVGFNNLAIAPFPTGTGNDFCRMFGDEKDMYRDMEALINGTQCPLDVIECNGRYSANICSVGIDARIGTQVHEYSGIPIIGHVCGYVISLVVNIARGVNQYMHIRSDGFEAEGQHALVCACNGRFYGGGFNPSLTAMPNDGIIDLFIIKGVSLLELVKLIGKYASGHGDDCPEYVTHLRTDNVEITFKEDQVVNIDGEAIFTKYVKMQLIPGAVNLIVPKGMKFFD
jgi:YegS/Rv2252/BmrU family lipid kinase